MAKDKNGRWRLIITGISAVLVLLGLVIGGVLAYADTANRTETNKEAFEEHKEGVTKGFEYMVKHQDKEMATLKEDGCKPAQKAGMDIKVIETKLDMVITAQEVNRKENKASFEKILEKL